jgi:hypothetical protein
MQNFDLITLVFEEIANFFAENCQKSQKIVITTSIPRLTAFPNFRGGSGDRFIPNRSTTDLVRKSASFFRPISGSIIFGNGAEKIMTLFPL